VRRRATTVDGERGFTLVELLIVMALTGIVMAGAYSVVMQSMRTEQYTDQLRTVMRPQDGLIPDALRLESLPGDWLETDLAERRQLFAEIVAGLIAAENARILSDRAALEAMRATEEAGRVLPLSQQARRDAIARRYGGQYGDLDDLLARADIIPLSLAISQAVVATGWGNAPAARERNALFGRPGPADGRFASLSASASDYAEILNTHRDFADFRAERARLRERNAPVTGPALAEYIRPYAAEGDAYINQVRAILAGADDLERFDARPATAPAPGS
jgi:potassium/hydrogen antiporter